MKRHKDRPLFVNTYSLGVVALVALLCGCEPAQMAKSPASIDANTMEPFRPLVVPAANETGDNVQVTRLLDEPHVKILSIRLRHGTELPTHNAPVPVIIQAISGTGTVIVGNDRVAVGEGRFVSLAPKISHRVLPDSDADLVLLVTQIRGGRK